MHGFMDFQAPLRTEMKFKEFLRSSTKLFKGRNEINKVMPIKGGYVFYHKLGYVIEVRPP